MKVDRKFSDIMDKEILDYSMYVIEDRAIPNMIDGLKPGQRFFLYSTIKNAGNTFAKVAAIGGIVSEYGYHHAEKAAQDAGALMANNWSNNNPVIQGRGNFGTRIVPINAAARYIYCKPHENFKNIFRDNEHAPAHWDLEHTPPRFYLPVIPYVLLNGIKGIAVGIAVGILPHDINSVCECVKQVLNTGTCDEPTVKYPEFKGNINQITDRKYILEGLYQYDPKRKTKLVITELPPKYNREKYVSFLDSLVDKDIIISYDVDCRDGFRFDINLKRDFDISKMSHEQILKYFKLTQSVTQNISVIGPNRSEDKSDIRIYSKASELIKDFVEYRLTYYPIRIEANINFFKEKIAYSNAKIQFIEKIISNEIDPRGKTKAATIKLIETFDELKGFGEKLISMNIYHLTKDEVEKLKNDVKLLKKELKRWESTTPKAEYLNDISEIMS